MNVSIVADVLLIGAAVVWILARQVQVGRVKPRLLWLVPLLLAFFGDPQPALLDLACARRSGAAGSQRGRITRSGRVARPDHPGLA